MADGEEAAKVRKVADSKSGVELYRELLRHYPHAELEDYYFYGNWRNEKLRQDIILIDAHRREAGAPDPLPLDEVPTPKIPAPPVFYGAPTLSVPKGITLPGGLAGGPVPNVAAAAAASAAVATGLAEIRAIVVFVSRWKLDAVVTKQLLAKLPPQRRRKVIDCFTRDRIDGGENAMHDLEAYVQKLEDECPVGLIAEPGPGTGAIVVPPEGGADTPLAVGAGDATGVAAEPKVITPKSGGGVSPPAISAVAAAEMRLVTLFVSKFKLDAVRTRALLATVPIHRRAQIVQNFASTLSGLEATDALEQFIKEFQPAAGQNGVSQENGSGAEAGTKRPLSVDETVENGAAKRRNVEAVPAESTITEY